MEGRHFARPSIITTGGFDLVGSAPDLCDFEKTYRESMATEDHVEREAVLETRDIGIAGMTCDNCVRKVEKALRGKPGVKEVKVDRGAAKATVTFDTTRTDMPSLHDALLRSGYTPTPPQPGRA